MLGPFHTPEEVWHASQGGAAFKLGITFCELKMVMRMRPPCDLRHPEDGMDPMFVYRFHSAKVDNKVLWYDFQHLGRNLTRIPEYDLSSACGMPLIQYRIQNDKPPEVPLGMSKLCWNGRTASRGVPGGINKKKEAKTRKQYKTREPVKTWSMHGAALPYSHVLLSQGTAAAAILKRSPQPYYQLGPPDFLVVHGGGGGDDTPMPEFNAVYEDAVETVLVPVFVEPVFVEPEQETVLPVPAIAETVLQVSNTVFEEALPVPAIAETVDPAQDVYGMLFDTLEVCKRLRLEGCVAGMGPWRLDSIGMIEDSIEDIQSALDEGETDSVVGALYDLRAAIGDYGWGMEMAGISRDKIEGVKRLWRAVKTLECGLATIVEV